MDELAGVGVVALTAYIGLINHCQIDQGNKKRILIIGGSGGVGTWAIQIAKSFDIHVTTICSGKNTDFVKSLGADVILDYQKDLDAQLKSVDLFDGCFDCVGGDEYYHMISPRMNVKAVYSTAVGPEIHGGNHPVGISNVFGVIDKIVWRNLFGMSYKIHHKS
jgi:NADPH:quinone reductase-like Zn-dependent oxidoreductase